MSETLVDFAQPLLSRLAAEQMTAEHWYAELAVAIVVWNGVVAEDSRQAIMSELAQCLPGRVVVPWMIDELIERKRVKFDDDKRHVIGFRTYERGDRVHVTALSAR